MSAIEISKTCWNEIETDLELWKNKEQSHWYRMFENGKRLGDSAIVERFDLKCTEYGEDVKVVVKNKESGLVHFEKAYFRYG